MAAGPARKQATYADVLAAPSNVVAEVIHGVLYTSPRPASPHTRATSVLGGSLGSSYDFGRDGPGGWIILDEPELHLGAAPDIVVPDIAGWRRERMPEMPDAPFFTLAPDWVCEALSPSTSGIDRGEKMDVYAREGVVHVWLVDATLRMLEVYRLANGAWPRLGTWREDARVRAEPFDAVELDLATLWRR